MKKALVLAMQALLAVVVIFPFLWMLSTSLKPMSEVASLPPKWITGNMTLAAYRDMFEFLPFGTFTLNSLYIAGITTILSLGIGVLAAYAFARLRFKGKAVLLLVFLLSQMLPGASIIVPLFQLIRRIGLYDTHIGLVLTHTALIIPFVIWLLYGFFKSIPVEIEQAALVDGCSRLHALHKVLLPLALPGIGATALFAFLGSWNEFFFAMLLTSSDMKRTIPVGIGLFVGEFSEVWNQMCAAAIFFSIPPLLLFMLLQKTFVKGLSAGAVK
jgi:ABC-type glycerol-3-phosphate transport system permease component